MTELVVDSDVWANVQRAGFVDAVAALGRLPVVVTDVVWDELTVGLGPRKVPVNAATDAARMLTAVAGGASALAPMSAEAATLVALQEEPATEGIGEHSVIAWALHHPGSIAVLHDRRAVYRGVEELRGRVLGFHGFLDVLVQHGLAPTDARAISGWYTRQFRPARPPLWWES